MILEVVGLLCFAILAHADEGVLKNQIENLRLCNPGAKIVLFNGGRDPNFGQGVDVDICPYSHPLIRGRLERFLIDVMRWLFEIDSEYDFLIGLDSDVLFLKTGFEEFVEKRMLGYDCMGINMHVETDPNEVPHWVPGQTMWKEWENWRSFFRSNYFCGTLNAMQVYRKEIVHKLMQNIDWRKLDDLLSTTQVYALEEILLPTLAVGSGAKYTTYPEKTARYVRLEVPWTTEQVQEVTQDPYAYFIHPVTRTLDDPVRRWITSHIQKSRKPPSTLTLVWGCYQGGVETSMVQRLRTMNLLEPLNHIYFYYGGSGLVNYQGIPHKISNDSQDLLQYIRCNSFDVITFVNTLYNLPELVKSGFDGICIFECHGWSPQIMKELHCINTGEDEGLISAIVVPGQYVKALVSGALWRRPELEVFVATNIVDTDHFTIRDATDGIQQLPLISSWRGSRYIGWVGRLDANKNWRLLLRIFKRVKASHPDVKLLIAGDATTSPDFQKFFEKVHHYGLTDDIKMFANLSYSDMPSFYTTVAASGGVFLSTSVSEGYPYNLLEAQACGCPVVSTMSGGAMEVVSHGITGFVCPSPEVDNAEKLIYKLFEQKELRQKIILQAREKVCTQNSAIRNIHKYSEWLRYMLRSKGRRSY